jgi:alanyl-tRNA synthetase
MSDLSLIRSKYLDYLRGLGHAIVPSAALVPENDPTTLFTSAGMQSMIPYFFGQAHPEGKRVANSQKCFRADDIEEVGDNRHTTFFEMLGNWSFGDYFKKEQIEFIFNFLTKELKLDPEKLYVSCFSGNSELGIERDDEAAATWQRLFESVGIEAKIVADPTQGLQGGRIFFYPEQKNWWSRSGVPANMPEGEPGGPDSEVFYDFGEQKTALADQFHREDGPCHINCDCGRFLEIGNSVFMQYQKTSNGFEPLAQANIDFGGGLERLLAAYQNQPDVFRTAAFWPLIEKIQEFSPFSYDEEDKQKYFRIIADHMKAAVMLMADGVFPSSKEQGYVLRRLLRRALRQAAYLEIKQETLVELVPIAVAIYADFYPELVAKEAKISQTLASEQLKFSKSLRKGLQEFERLLANKDQLTAKTAFKLYESFGFPLEISLEEAAARGISTEAELKENFAKLRESHAASSRASLQNKFKSGLADHGETVVKYHTATHLLHQALRQVLGESVEQKGSNITAERLRFDFSFERALTESEKSQVEQLINDWIKADLAVDKQTLPKEEALKSGAIALFVEKYPDIVNVYSIGQNPNGEQKGKDFISREFCSGPHVQRTSDIGAIELTREKAVADGIRRIYALQKSA